MERHGEIMFLKEFHGVDKTLLINKYVRITGFMIYHNPLNSTAKIEHNNYSILLDLELISTGKLIVGSLYQFIGEVQAINEKVSYYV